jgi:hypothetical protein
MEETVQAASTPYHCEVAKKTGGNTSPGKPTGFFTDRTWEKRRKQPAHRSTVKSQRMQAATPPQASQLSSLQIAHGRNGASSQLTVPL